MLLERHLGLDAAVSDRIAAGEVGQVLEVAAGLSGRGLRLTRRHPELVYVETDLPGMARRKRALLEGRGGLAPGHRVEPLDVSVAGELETRLAALDPAVGTVVVVEGLLPYLPRPALEALLARLAAALAPFPAGLLVTDLNFAEDLRGGLTALTARGVQQGLRVLVGHPVHVHFATPDEARAAFLRAGFLEVRFAAPRPRPHPPLVRVVTASR